MVLNLVCLLKSYWGRQRIVAKTDKFLRKNVWTGRGVELVVKFPASVIHSMDAASPMIFNIVVDAVVRAVLDVVCQHQEYQHVLVWAAGERNVVFMLAMARYQGGIKSGSRMHYQ